MDSNISDLLIQLKQGQNDIHTIVQTMNKKRQEYEDSLIPLRNRYNNVSMQLKEIGETMLSIKLSDLIEEIAWLSNTSYDDVMVSLKTNIFLEGVYDKTEFLQLVELGTNNLIRFSLSNCGQNDNNASVLFDYFSFLSFVADSIQADGKTLLEHCSVVSKKNSNGKYYTELVIDQDVENIILNFKISCLTHNDGLSWYPADLFSQTVLNCDERRYNKKVDRIRQRIKISN